MSPSDPVSAPVAVPRPEPSGTREDRVKVRQPQDEILDEGFDHRSYRATYGVPFLVDHLGIKELYKGDPGGEITEKVNEINEYLEEESGDEKMIFIFKDILERMEQEMNIGEKDAGLYRLKKIHQLMKARKKILELDEIKKQVIDDIENMM